VGGVGKLLARLGDVLLLLLVHVIYVPLSAGHPAVILGN
jgi:hypothetical protein